MCHFAFTGSLDWQPVLNKSMDHKMETSGELVDLATTYQVCSELVPPDPAVWDPLKAQVQSPLKLPPPSMEWHAWLSPPAPRQTPPPPPSCRPRRPSVWPCGVRPSVVAHSHSYFPLALCHPSRPRMRTERDAGAPKVELSKARRGAYAMT